MYPTLPSCACSCHTSWPRHKLLKGETLLNRWPLQGHQYDPDKSMIVRSRVVTRCCTQFPARLVFGDSTSRTGLRDQTYSTVTDGVKPSLYGQPQPSTHPHLFERADELTPGIRAQEYAQRRKRLMESLPDGSAVLAVAGTTKYMSGCELSEQPF
jgi:hypothetical protein